MRSWPGAAIVPAMARSVPWLASETAGQIATPSVVALPTSTALRSFALTESSSPQLDTTSLEAQHEELVSFSCYVDVALERR